MSYIPIYCGDIPMCFYEGDLPALASSVLQKWQLDYFRCAIRISAEHLFKNITSMWFTVKRVNYEI